MDCRSAERKLLRICRLSSSAGLIPSNRTYTGSSHRDYSIHTLPLTESSSNSGSSSSVASAQQQIIQRKRIHPPPKIHRPALTGPMYGVRWIYKIDPHYVGSHNFLLTPQLSGDGPPRLAGQRRARYPSASMRRSPVH